MEVLAANIRRSFSRPAHSFSKSEAKWIVHIRKIAPDLELGKVFLLANFYRIREVRKASTHDLDAFLALAPWRDKADEYREFIDRGKIRPVPMLSLMLAVDDLDEEPSPEVDDREGLHWSSPHPAVRESAENQGKEGS